eukprot:jgi/Hompol1/3016/HPOL_003089-RA
MPGKIPSGNYGDFSVIMTLAVSLAAAAATLFLSVRLALEALRRSPPPVAARTFKAFASIISLIASTMLLIVIVHHFIIVTDILPEVSLKMSALCMLGMMHLQFEIRRVFGVLFLTKSGDIMGRWTPPQIVAARIGVAALHLLLCWPVYVRGLLNLDEASRKSLTSQFVIGYTLQSLIIITVSGMQSQTIIARLIDIRASRIGQARPISSSRKRWMTAWLVTTVVSETIGIASLLWSSLIQQQGDAVRSGLLNLISMTCLCVEVLSEASVFLIMLRLVATRIDQSYIEPASESESASTASTRAREDGDDPDAGTPGGNNQGLTEIELSVREIVEEAVLRHNPSGKSRQSELSRLSAFVQNLTPPPNHK